MAKKMQITWSAATGRQVMRMLVVAVAIVAAILFARGTGGSSSASTSSSGSGVTPGGGPKVYSLTLSKPSFVGPAVLLHPSDCRAALDGSDKATSLVRITISGASIEIEADNMTFRGTYTRSKRSFITSARLPAPSSAETVVAAFDGDLESSGAIMGGYSLTAYSPQASCVYLASASPVT